MRCIDGACRKECRIRHSSCPHDSPVKCADGRCVSSLVECASIGCEPNSPYLCPDGSCKGALDQCRYPFNSRVIRAAEKKTKGGTSALKLLDQRDKLVGTMFVEEVVDLSWRGVALSELEKSVLEVDKLYDPLFFSFLSMGVGDLQPRDFLRSAVVRISTNRSDPDAEYDKPITLHLRTDRLAGRGKFRRVHKKVG